MADEVGALPDGTVQSGAGLAQRLALNADAAIRERRVREAIEARDSGVRMDSEVYDRKSMGAISTPAHIASATKGVNLGMETTRMPIMLSPEGEMSRMAALEVAEAHVAQLEQIKNDRGYAKYSMTLAQRTMHLLAYADWLCGGEPPKDLK